MKPVLLVAFTPMGAPKEKLEALSRLVPPHHKVVTLKEGEDFDPWKKYTEVSLGYYPPRLIPDSPRLRWVQLWYAGVDHYLSKPEVMNADFQLTSASGIHAGAVTEQLFAGLLALIRRLPAMLYDQADRRWVAWGFETLETLEGRHLLIIGAGAIGRRCAAVGKALGMKVTAIVRSSGSASIPSADRVERYELLSDCLGEADVVMILTPLTSITRGMFGRSEFASMKSGAILVNGGRGAVVDRTALEEALESGHLGGAVLDVTDPEPLPRESPLWNRKNVIITPHVGGFHTGLNEKIWELFLENTVLYFKGKPLRNLVDRNIGY